MCASLNILFAASFLRSLPVQLCQPAAHSRNICSSLQPLVGRVPFPLLLWGVQDRLRPYLSFFFKTQPYNIAAAGSSGTFLIPHMPHRCKPPPARPSASLQKGTASQIHPSRISSPPRFLYTLQSKLSAPVLPVLSLPVPSVHFLGPVPHDQQTRTFLLLRYPSKAANKKLHIFSCSRRPTAPTTSASSHPSLIRSSSRFFWLNLNFCVSTPFAIIHTLLLYPPAKRKLAASLEHAAMRSPRRADRREPAHNEPAQQRHILCRGGMRVHNPYFISKAFKAVGPEGPPSVSRCSNAQWFAPEHAMSFKCRVLAQQIKKCVFNRFCGKAVHRDAFRRSRSTKVLSYSPRTKI